MRWGLPDNGLLTHASSPVVDTCDTDGYPLCGDFNLASPTDLDYRVGIVATPGPLPDGGAVIHFRQESPGSCAGGLCPGGCNGDGDTVMP
jgi:hypothetical protein